MVHYLEACLYLPKQDYAAAQDQLEHLSTLSRVMNEFNTDVNLALLSIYRMTANHEGAKLMYSLIMMSRPINDSHAKAKEIMKS
jgi:hypothetical protein